MVDSDTTKVELLMSVHNSWSTCNYV